MPRMVVTADIVVDPRHVHSPLPMQATSEKRPLVWLATGHERPTLTARQLQVFRLLNEGLSYDRVATTLGLSENTARRYAADAIARMKAENIRHALYIARRNGLISDGQACEAPNTNK